MKDEHEEKAEKLLPCEFGETHCEINQAHIDCCPAYFRPAVADALRAQAERYTALNTLTVNAFRERAEVLRAQAEVKDELIRTAEALNASLRTALDSQAEAHKAEIENTDRRDRMKIRALEDARDNYRALLATAKLDALRAAKDAVGAVSYSLSESPLVVWRCCDLAIQQLIDAAAKPEKKDGV